jgi:hypothetical protein
MRKMQMRQQPGKAALFAMMALCSAECAQVQGSTLVATPQAGRKYPGPCQIEIDEGNDGVYEQKVEILYDLHDRPTQFVDISNPDERRTARLIEYQGNTTTEKSDENGDGTWDIGQTIETDDEGKTIRVEGWSEQTGTVEINFTYDEDGLLVSSEQTNVQTGSSTKTNIANQKNRRVKTEAGLDGVLRTVSIEYLDSTGKTIKEERFSHKGEMISITESSYTPEGWLQREVSLVDGVVLSSHDYQYDAYGNVAWKMMYSSTIQSNTQSVDGNGVVTKKNSNKSMTKLKYSYLCWLQGTEPAPSASRF